VNPRPGLVVCGWALLNAVLVGVLVLFRGDAVETGLYSAGIAIVTGFGLAVLLAAARHRDGQQMRQPVRSSSMSMLAAAALLVGLGAVFHWWIAAIAVYPLAAVLALHTGEQLPRAADPVPATTSTAEAPIARLAGTMPYTGSPLGNSVPLPDDHPARAAPRHVPHHSARGWRRVFVLLVVLRAVLGRRRK
jgi:hypothetical protein